jgi:hypothetical protein
VSTPLHHLGHSSTPLSPPMLCPASPVLFALVDLVGLQKQLLRVLIEKLPPAPPLSLIGAAIEAAGSGSLGRSGASAAVIGALPPAAASAATASASAASASVSPLKAPLVTRPPVPPVEHDMDLLIAVHSIDIEPVLHTRPLRMLARAECWVSFPAPVVLDSLLLVVQLRPVDPLDTDSERERERDGVGAGAAEHERPRPRDGDAGTTSRAEGAPASQPPSPLWTARPAPVGCPPASLLRQPSSSPSPSLVPASPASPATFKLSDFLGPSQHAAIAAAAATAAGSGVGPAEDEEAAVRFICLLPP